MNDAKLPIKEHRASALLENPQMQMIAWTCPGTNQHDDKEISLHVLVEHVPFPLTPALSRGEREPRMAVHWRL